MKMSDTIYLENLEEYVRDDRKIVTCKWLCRTLSVPMNTAKKMLYHYITSQDSQSAPLSVMYCITGRLKPTEDNNSTSIQVMYVSDNELEETKKQYTEIWSVHVYSVQLSPVKDSSTLYSADFEMSRDNLSEYNKWNTISCDIVSCDKRLPTVPCVVPIANVWSSEKCDIRPVIKNKPVFETHNKTEKKQTVKKKSVPTKGKPVSSFFNTKNETSKKTKSLEDNNRQKTSISKTTPTSVQGSIPASNQVKIENHEVSDIIPVKVESIVSTGLQDSDFEDDDDLCSDKPTSVVEVKEGSGKHRKNDKRLDKTNIKKKRRRVHAMSSDEDGDVIGKDSEPVIEGKNVTKKTKVKQRKREKKLITKMYMTADGSMITEKVYEDVSTDASSSEEGKENEDNAGSLIKNTLIKKEKQSPSKQPTLLSFFKK